MVRPKWYGLKYWADDREIPLGPSFYLDYSTNRTKWDFPFIPAGDSEPPRGWLFLGAAGAVLGGRRVEIGSALKRKGRVWSYRIPFGWIAYFFAIYHLGMVSRILDLKGFGEL